MYDEAFENMRAESVQYMREKTELFLSKWCKEAGVKSPVGYERDYSSRSFTVYTDRPGYLIGKGGALAKKIRDTYARRVYRPRKDFFRRG